MHISKGLKQAYDVQDFAYEALLALRASLTKDGRMVLAREDALAIKALTGAWESAQQRVAFHRRVPSPGVARPSPEAPRRRLRKPAIVEAELAPHTAA